MSNIDKTILSLVFGLIGLIFVLFTLVGNLATEPPKYFKQEDIMTNIATLEYSELYFKPSTSVVFCNETNAEIGRLELEGKEIKFIGNADESAKIFFEHYLKNIVDNYLKENDYA